MIGAAAHVEIDYKAEAIAQGEVFILTTDGVHDHWSPKRIARHVETAADLDVAAQAILEGALAAGSADNVTV